MQSTSAAFTVQEKSPVRKVATSLLVSWHNQYLLTAKTFTIGVSLIGGNDLIGINPGAVGSPGSYKYFDESTYLTKLEWERGYNMPQGGLTMGLGAAELDNTTKRFLPRYMGGKSELSTAMLPRRPVIINTGFNYGGIDNTLPGFAGIISQQPQISTRNALVNLAFADYVLYFQNKYLDKVTMFTSQFTDQVLKTLFVDLGMSTAQYKLDAGINLIPFGIFDVGTKFSDAIGQLVEAENGQLYQDEFGVFRFENRQHWTQSPYNQIQKVVSTAMVIDAEVTQASYLTNAVEINSNVRTKQPDQLLFSLSQPTTLAANTDTTIFVQFNDPVIALDTPTQWTANTASDGSGTDISGSVTLKSISLFAQSAKLIFSNNSSQSGYLNALTLYGRPAQVTNQIQYQAQDSSSVTAFQEQLVTINNDFIQSQAWAQTYAQMILNDYSNPTNLQKLTVRTMPDLQLGDLISWQGKYWRILDIKVTLDPSQGFVQELLIIQRTIQTYFRIGISTIGGSDQISP